MFYLRFSDTSVNIGSIHILCFSSRSIMTGMHLESFISIAGADPGFPVGGGANPRGGGRQHMILPNFVKNYMKLRKFWAVGGWGVPGAPPKSATE